MAVSLFVGVPGAGKTQAMVDLCAKQAMTHVFMVCSQAREWEDLKSPRWRGQGKKLPIVSVGATPDKRDDVVEELLEVKNGVFVFGYPWEPWEVANVTRDVGNAVYVDDEIDMFAEYKSWSTNPLRDFVHRGRHLPNINGDPSTVDIYGAARRVQNLHTDLTSMADEVLVFRSQGKHTIKRLVEEGYIDDAEVEHVRAMPNMQFCGWRSSGEKFYGVIDNPYT